MKVNVSYPASKILGFVQEWHKDYTHNRSCTTNFTIVFVSMHYKEQSYLNKKQIEAKSLMAKWLLSSNSKTWKEGLLFARKKKTELNSVIYHLKQTIILRVCSITQSRIVRMYICHLLPLYLAHQFVYVLCSSQKTSSLQHFVILTALHSKIYPLPSILSNQNYY